MVSSRDIATGSLLLLLAVSLQGCVVLDVPRHSVGYWEQEVPYLQTFQVTGQASLSTPAVVNSCAIQDLEESQRCSGHGLCKEWFGASQLVGNQTQRSLSFCSCDTYWAGPECSTLRKSQYTAYFLSIFFGFVGADQFYLGWWALGVLKAITLGLLGGWVIRDMLGSFVSYETQYFIVFEWERFKAAVLCVVLPWYVFDIVNIGSTEVYTADRFSVAHDLPYYAFVISLVGLMGFHGFTMSIWSIQRQRAHKAREMLLLRAEAAETICSERVAWPSYSSKSFASTTYAFDGYGSTLLARPPEASVVREPPPRSPPAFESSTPPSARRFLDASLRQSRSPGRFGTVESPRELTPQSSHVQQLQYPQHPPLPLRAVDRFRGHRASFAEMPSPSGASPALDASLRPSGGSGRFRTLPPGSLASNDGCFQTLPPGSLASRPL